MNCWDASCPLPSTLQDLLFTDLHGTVTKFPSPSLKKRLDCANASDAALPAALHEHPQFPSEYLNSLSSLTLIVRLEAFGSMYNHAKAQVQFYETALQRLNRLGLIHEQLVALQSCGAGPQSRTPPAPLAHSQLATLEAELLQLNAQIDAIKTYQNALKVIQQCNRPVEATKPEFVDAFKTLALLQGKPKEATDALAHGLSLAEKCWMSSLQDAESLFSLDFDCIERYLDDSSYSHLANDILCPLSHLASFCPDSRLTEAFVNSYVIFKSTFVRSVCRINQDSLSDLQIMSDVIERTRLLMASEAKHFLHLFPKASPSLAAPIFEAIGNFNLAVISSKAAALSVSDKHHLTNLILDLLATLQPADPFAHFLNFLLQSHFSQAMSVIDV